MKTFSSFEWIENYVCFFFYLSFVGNNIVLLHLNFYVHVICVTVVFAKSLMQVVINYCKKYDWQILSLEITKYADVSFAIMGTLYFPLATPDLLISSFLFQNLFFLFLYLNTLLFSLSLRFLPSQNK